MYSWKIHHYERNTSSAACTWLQYKPTVFSWKHEKQQQKLGLINSVRHELHLGFPSLCWASLKPISSLKHSTVKVHSHGSSSHLQQSLRESPPCPAALPPAPDQGIREGSLSAHAILAEKILHGELSKWAVSNAPALQFSCIVSAKLTGVKSNKNCFDTVVGRCDWLHAQFCWVSRSCRHYILDLNHGELEVEDAGTEFWAKHRRAAKVPWVSHVYGAAPRI